MARTFRVYLMLAFERLVLKSGYSTGRTTSTKDRKVRVGIPEARFARRGGRRGLLPDVMRVPLVPPGLRDTVRAKYTLNWCLGARNSILVLEAE